MTSAAPQPVVSVCIPLYRGAAHLGATIDSVLAQTYRDFELLIIDDGSPDESFAIASIYRDARIRCLRNPRNLGPEGNWNRCLEEATGRYVKLLPQDDVLAPSCLQRQVDAFEQDTAQRIALVFCARTIIGARGNEMMVRRPFGREARRITGALLFRRCLWRGTNVIGEPGGILFRRDLASRIGRFDATFPYVVDLDFWLRLLAHGDGWYIPDSLVSFRVSSGAWSVAIGASQAAEFRGLAARAVKDGVAHATVLDLAAGGILARLNNVARLLIYRFVLTRGPLA
jgi:glycosyltransferase involved in cell wall biosynthesis